MASEVAETADRIVKAVDRSTSITKTKEVTTEVVSVVVRPLAASEADAILTAVTVAAITTTTDGVDMAPVVVALSEVGHSRTTSERCQPMSTIRS